jgi:hypothetical protein
MKKSYNFTIQEIKELCVRSFIRGSYFDQKLEAKSDKKPVSFNAWLDEEITKILSEKEGVGDDINLETELDRVLNGEPKKKFFDFFKWFK